MGACRPSYHDTCHVCFVNGVSRVSWSERRQTGWRSHQSDTSYTEYCWQNQALFRVRSGPAASWDMPPRRSVHFQRQLWVFLADGLHQGLTCSHQQSCLVWTRIIIHMLTLVASAHLCNNNTLNISLVIISFFSEITFFSRTALTRPSWVNVSLFWY